VRYLDNILLGFFGPMPEVLNILKKINNFFKFSTGLYFSKNNITIKHITKGIFFLSYILKGAYLISNITKNFNINLSNYILTFIIPLKLLFKRFQKKGFIQQAKRTKRLRFIGRRVDK
jgi:hypothetical protein